MDLDSEITLLNYLYNATNIPICVYQGDTLLLQTPVALGFLERIQKYIAAMKEQHKKITYLVTSYEALYALIRVERHDLWIFAGPYFTLPVTAKTLPTILNEIKLSKAAEADARVFLTSVPTGPQHKFLSYLASIYASLTQEMITIEEIAYHPLQKELPATIQQIYADRSYDEPDKKPYHGTYLHEAYRLELIATGNVEAMKKNTITMLPVEQGRIGPDSLRQAKNIFIAGCTLYTRAAIAGGLDVEEAYNLSDVYIQTCESYTTVAEVERLHQHMPLDFTERVAHEVKLKNVSQLIIDAVHFIKENVNQPIQTSDIAEHVNLSQSYFLKRFKSETGIGVTDYITKAKIEEACLLLSYTDKSLTEISNYLYFSSQSYFQNVFKKQMHMTPRQYRNMKKTQVFLREYTQE